ncbi:MAG: PilZ domain-containing protein [Spirochaetia bacterium]|nr:PilZ domain-containing protein [Spirochaetia bacterium]
MTERRAHPRFAISRELIISAVEPVSQRRIEYYSRSVNVSRGGMLFYTIAQFHEKTPCECRFQTAKGERILHRPGTILRTVDAAEVPEGLPAQQQLYALEFNKLLSDEEVLLIADLTEDQLRQTLS